MISDNGAAAEDFYNVGGFVPWLRRNFDNSYEKMGTPESYVAYGPQWADAGSAPFRGHKQHATEGGIVAPMIVAGPGIDAAGSIESAYAGVMDLAPTFLELAGGSYPGDSWDCPNQAYVREEHPAAPLRCCRRSSHGDSEVLGPLPWRRQSFLRIGDWKLVSNQQYQGGRDVPALRPGHGPGRVD